MSRPDFSVGVCGFGRSGSTMVMSMLDAAGCPPVGGSAPGTYELADMDALYDPLLPASRFAGHAVKLLTAVSRFGTPGPPEMGWRFVWLDRDPVEQARSTVKFLHDIAGQAVTDHDTAVAQLSWSYQHDRPARLGELRRLGDVTVLSFERVLANPKKAAKKLRAVWPDLNVDQAAAAVHDRDGSCRPDCTVEETLAQRAGWERTP